MLDQTFDSFEFIIINDASTDDSRDILNEYARQDPRVKLFENEENIGLTKSLNKALHLAKGSHIARQDADDISLPNRLARQVAVLNSQPEVVLVSSDIEVVDAEGRFVRIERRSCSTELVPWYLTFYNHIGGHSQVAFRRETALALNGYSESYQYSQDYDFWCRLDKVGKICILPEVLHKLRRHGKGITAEKRKDQLAYSFQQSRNNVEQLIGQELSTEELLALKQFWSGQLWNKFPDSQHAARLHVLQQELSVAFAKRQPNVVLEAKMASQLDGLIKRQFIAWIGSLHPFLQFSERAKLSYFAVRWAPLRLIFLWMKSYFLTPFLILGRRFMRKIDTKKTRGAVGVS